MMWPDEEWIRVSLVHGILNKTRDVDVADESTLHLENYGNVRWNCPSYFWSILESMREIISDVEEALA